MALTGGLSRPPLRPVGHADRQAACSGNAPPTPGTLELMQGCSTARAGAVGHLARNHPRPGHQSPALVVDFAEPPLSDPLPSTCPLRQPLPNSPPLRPPPTATTSRRLVWPRQSEHRAVEDPALRLSVGQAAWPPESGKPVCHQNTAPASKGDVLRLAPGGSTTKTGLPLPCSVDRRACRFNSLEESPEPLAGWPAAEQVDWFRNDLLPEALWPVAAGHSLPAQEAPPGWPSSYGRVRSRSWGSTVSQLEPPRSDSTGCCPPNLKPHSVRRQRDGRSQEAFAQGLPPPQKNRGQPDTSPRLRLLDCPPQPQQGRPPFAGNSPRKGACVASHALVLFWLTVRFIGPRCRLVGPGRRALSATRLGLSIYTLNNQKRKPLGSPALTCALPMFLRLAEHYRCLVKPCHVCLQGSGQPASRHNGTGLPPLCCGDGLEAQGGFLLADLVMATLVRFLGFHFRITGWNHATVVSW